MRQNTRTAMMGLLLVTLLLSGGACGNLSNTMLRSVATGSVLVSGGYKAAGVIDRQTQDKIRLLARNDWVQAQAQLTAWLKKYDTTIKVLDAATVTVQTALAAVPVIDLAVNKTTQLTAWIFTLTQLVLDVTKALSDIGVSLPSPTGAPPSPPSTFMPTIIDGEGGNS